MTAHIAAKQEEIAKVVIMPGDPLRAKFMAEKFLENPRCINEVRGMLGFTGTYKDKLVTIMASGMGAPSMGIYAYELFKFYDVEEIIRLGSFGAYDENLKLNDMVIVRDAYSDSSFAEVQTRCRAGVMRATPSLLDKLILKAHDLGFHPMVGRMYSSDVFYSDYINHDLMHSVFNCLGTEMECFALFHTARFLNKKAGAIVTASDHFKNREKLSPKEREEAFSDMFKIALEVACEEA